MARQTNVLLLLLAICIAAGALAVFVHDINTAATPPAQVAQTPVPVAPLRIDQVATTTPVVLVPTPAAQEYKSTDGVTSAVVDAQKYDCGYLDLSVHGTSTAFENQIHWRLQSGKKIGEGSIYVSSTDVGIPGPYQLSHTVEISQGATTTLSVYEPSPKDGTPLHVVEIPFGIFQTAAGEPCN